MIWSSSSGPDPSSPASAASLMVLLRFVRPVFRHLRRVIEQRLEGTGISPPMRGLLERIYESGPASVPALARSLELPRQFAQTIADEATRIGLTERRPNPAHRKSSLITLTPDGRAAVEAMLAREMDALTEIAGQFDADDVETATRVLGDLAATLRAFAAAGEDAASDEPPLAAPDDRR